MRFKERLVSSSRKHGSRVVLALDVTGPPETRPERAAGLLEELADSVAAVKLNFQVLLPRGLEGVAGVASICSEEGIPLIADIKLNDIESTNVEAVRLLFEGGFDAVIANPLVGYEEGLSRVMSLAGEDDKGVLLLVYMSHAGAKEGYGLELKGKPLYLEFARRVKAWGADGAIVSAKSLDIVTQVREIIGRDRLILSPGIGVQGGDASRAVRAGTDFAIVGRSIVESPEPRRALQELNRSIPAP